MILWNSAPRFAHLRHNLSRRGWLPLVVGILLLTSGVVGVGAGLVESADSPLTAPLTVGVTYLPPPDTPESRLYQEEGFELELAAELSRALGVAVEPVLVAPEEQMRALAEGRVDALIMRPGPDTALPPGAHVLPSGFSSGLSAVMRSDTSIRRWEDLAGRTVCVSQAHVQAQELARKLGASVRIYRAPAPTLIGARTGECDAALHDQASITPLFQKREWQRFNATLPETTPVPLVVVVAQDKPVLARQLRRALSQTELAATWPQRQQRWAGTVAFEVYRDQVAGDCH